MSDTRGSFTGRSVDVSRGGIFAATSEIRPVGTLLRTRVLGPRGETVLAVGVVVRCFTDLESSSGGVSPGLAIALTSTSEAWDRFWDDVSATNEFDDDDDDISGSGDDDTDDPEDSDEGGSKADKAP